MELKKLEKERELVIQRYNEVKRKEEISKYEQQRLEEARKNLEYRYKQLPNRYDIYPQPFY